MINLPASLAIELAAFSASITFNNPDTIGYGAGFKELFLIFFLILLIKFIP
jgi:hypothetical protein